MNRRSLLTGSAACAMAAGFPVKPSALPTIRPGDRSFAEYVRRHMDHLASCMVLTFDEVVASYRASEARAVRW